LRAFANLLGKPAVRCTEHGANHGRRLAQEATELHGFEEACEPGPREGSIVVKRGVRPVTLAVVAATTLMVALAGRPAWAQADPNPGAMTITGSMDFLNQYMFRGLRQNSTGMVMWPAFDLGIALHEGKGGLKTAGVNVGTWNSLHTGDTGLDGPSGKLWYESDFYASLGLGFGHGTSLGTTYTAYTSPNNGFSTVREISFKVAVDDSGPLGKFAVKPYVIFAFEIGAVAGTGQADGGNYAGKYVEVGGAPGYASKRFSVAVPVKVGLSADNYYEHPQTGVDSKFGYLSIAGIVTVPLGGTTEFGAWNVHFGGEFQQLGETAKYFNGGESNQFIGSVGLGFSY
jgi:hypothetical protein